VFLGQRVLILTNSPTVIRQDMPIDLPDPRDLLHSRSSPRFAELARRSTRRSTVPREG
jgi:NitT/TauT family transport system ATP-binding protein